jgi:addiction module RelE/StbE family toxin
MIKKIVYDKSFEKDLKNIKITYLKKLSELREQIEIFKNKLFDSKLKTDKLKGKLKDYWAFSVSYSKQNTFSFFRIDIGNHNIYK